MFFTRPVSCVALAASILCICVSVGAAQQSGPEPAELPSAGYAGTEYVDSAGCVFIRAGIGDVVKWVPRVTRERRQVCGLKPTYSLRAGTPAAAPVVKPQNPTRAATPKKAAPTLKAAPKPQRPRNSMAGLVVTPGTAAAKGVSGQARVLPRHIYEERQAMRPVTAPKNFVAAWKDGRLNPRRAEQSLKGHEQMQKVWTNTLPRRLVD